MHNTTSTFRNDIQGLRAIAVLIVIIFHTNHTWLPAGFLGVDIFFVISGYVVSLSILNSNKPFSWKQFYISRIKRIIPAYLLLLIIVTILASILFIPNDFNWYKESLLSSLYFNSNSYFSNFGSYFAPNAYELPLLHTWSLAVEMKFYFLLPILITITPKKYIGSICIIIISILLIVSELAIQKDSHNIYFALWARIPEFLFGVLLANYNYKLDTNKLLSNILALFGIVVIMFALWNIKSTNYPGIQLLLPCLGVSLIICAKNSILNQVLSKRLFVIIGSLSYSLYLWHWPILAFIRYYTESYTLSPLLLSSYIIITIILSILSYILIEKPLRTLPTKNSIKCTLIISCFLLITILCSKLTHKYHTIPLPTERTRYAEGSIICHGQILQSCNRGSKKESADILVIGDSHTAQLNYFYDYIGYKSGITFEVISGSSCIPIANFNVKKLPQWAQESCHKQTEAVSKKLDTYNIIILGAFWDWQLADNQTYIAIEDFLHSQNKDKKIILMGQLPVYTTNIQRQMHFHHINLPIQMQQKTNWDNANKLLKKLSLKYANTTLFDISKTNFLATPFINNQPIYYDQSHLNEVGAKIYAEYAYSPLIQIIKGFTSK